MISKDIRYAVKHKQLPICQYLQNTGMDGEERHTFIVKMLNSKYGNTLFVEEEYEDVEDSDYDGSGYVTPDIPEGATIIEEDFTPSTPYVPATYHDPPEGGDDYEYYLLYEISFTDLVEYVEFEYDLFEEDLEAFFYLYVFTPSKRAAYIEKVKKKEEARKQRLADRKNMRR